MANGNPMGEPQPETIPAQAVTRITKKDLPPTSGERSPTDRFDREFKSNLARKGLQKQLLRTHQAL